MRQEALVLPKDGLQNLLQSVDRNGNLYCPAVMQAEK